MKDLNKFHFSKGGQGRKNKRTKKQMGPKNKNKKER